MQKQNQEKSSFYHLKRITNRNSRPSIHWNQQHFNQLYPIVPQMLTSSTFFIVGLHYHGILLKVKLPTGIATQHLPYLFHKEIYQYLLNARDSNPLLKTAEVVGFQSVDQDLLLDYEISIGKGVLRKKTSFNCLEYNDDDRLKKYKIYKCLAMGGFSKVYLVRSLRDGNFYAMKVMLKKFITQNSKQGTIENEKQICKQLNHPFIVKLNQCFETHNFVCFVFQYCPGGQLFYLLKKVKRFSEEHARFYFTEILYGLMYLHQQNIIYRDLKPENLLLNYDGHVKIADFGLSKGNINQRQVTYSFCGSTQYMPPQMIQRQGHSYGVDFYTLGALLYELVTGLPPFYSNDEEKIKSAILNQQLTFPIGLSNDIISLLKGLLNKNPKLRIGSMKGLKEILFHPWMGKINSEYILSKKLTPPYIPSSEEFNFDDSELGSDEKDFTKALVNQHLIPQSKEKLILPNFEFKNENHLISQVQYIYDNYPPKKPIMAQSSSVKCFNTIKSHAKSPLKRQSSSPYLFASISSIDRPSRYNNLLPSKMSKNNKTVHKSPSKKKLENAYISICRGNNYVIKRDMSSKFGFLKKQKYVHHNV